MKAILQYASASGGPYKNCGTIRSSKNQDYKVTALTDDNRLGEPETIGYEIKIQALILTLNTDFLDLDTWYFRLVFPNDLEMILLGERKYIIDFDGLITRHGIVYHTISLNFNIDPDEYADYAVPGSLPEEEGGIILDDAGIYIE
jgi:hypothetical protein